MFLISPRIQYSIIITSEAKLKERLKRILPKKNQGKNKKKSKEKIPPRHNTFNQKQV